jgi:hypothetical protein
MHYVAIDPSPVHTAIVSWGVDNNGMEHLNGKTKEILPAVQSIKRGVELALEAGLDVTVVIERPPQTPRGATTESQQTIAAYWMIVWTIQSVDKRFQINIVSLAPGSWKPAAKGWGIEYPSTLTDQHQRDAYAMLQVHLATKGAKR